MQKRPEFVARGEELNRCGLPTGCPIFCTRAEPLAEPSAARHAQGLMIGSPGQRGASAGLVRRVCSRSFCIALGLAALAFVAPDATAAEPGSVAPGSVVPPRLLSEANVPYPENGEGEHIVRLTVTVASDGTVRAATPDAIDEPFSSLARASVLTWRFDPATRAGTPIAAKIRLELVFHAPVPAPVPVPDTAPAPVPIPVPASPPAPVAVEIVVPGERPEPSRTATLSRAEVRELPGAFGDPFRALEGLPGVTPIVSGLPFFFVRGAPPGNVGYFLDGVRLPLLFHIGIGPAVVHPALIDHVDLYPGGYPARFGRFSGGIIAGETAVPRGEVHGEYNLRLFDAGALVEAPFAKGRGSALLAGRYSYSALLLSLLSPDVTLDYWDYQARIGYDIDARQRVSAFAFGSYDYLGQKTQDSQLTLFGTQFHRVDLRYDVALPRSGTFRTAFTVGVDRSRVQEDRFARDRIAAARTELNQPISENLRVRAGTELQLDHYDIELGPGDLSPATISILELFPARTDLALGLRGDLVWAPSSVFEITPGLRVDLYGSQGRVAFGVDPRLATRTTLTPRVHLLSALGIAHQPASVVVPLPGFQPGGEGGLQYALQESFGVEALLGNGTTATATLFQNGFFNMSDPLGVLETQVSGCPPGAFPSDSLAGDRGIQPESASACGLRFPAGTLGPDFSGGAGQGADGRSGNRIRDAVQVRTQGAAYGLELYVKRKLTSRVGGFFSYTLSRSTRSYGDRKFVATFDRTHVVNAALAYDLGRRWRAGARVVFYTGLPQARDADASLPSRLPPFFRTDLRLEKRWQFRREVWLSFVAEWMNATLSKEAVSTRCTLSGCEYQEIGPVTIPSVGLEGGF